VGSVGPPERGFSFIWYQMHRGRPSADQWEVELDLLALRIKAELEVAKGQREGGRQHSVCGQGRSCEGGASERKGDLIYVVHEERLPVEHRYATQFRELSAEIQGSSWKTGPTLKPVSDGFHETPAFRGRAQSEATSASKLQRAYTTPEAPAAAAKIHRSAGNENDGICASRNGRKRQDQRQQQSTSHGVYLLEAVFLGANDTPRKTLGSCPTGVAAMSLRCQPEYPRAEEQERGWFRNRLFG
jgi:hypothetical protein